MLVLDAVAEIVVPALADLRLQYMCGRRTAVRHVPAILPVEQRGLVLCARDGNAKFGVVTHAERRVGKIGKAIGDFFITDRPGVDFIGLAGIFAVRQKPERADAVPADG